MVMDRRRGTGRHGYTLLEVVLVTALLAVVAAIAIPNLILEIRGAQLETSAEQLRSLVELVRANAQMDGKRYRIRFPREDEMDRQGTDVQPIIERADDPLEPEEWTLVEEPWTLGETLLRDCWCIQVRLGRPTIEKLRDPEASMSEELANLREDFAPEYPPVIFEPDGTAPWAVFVVTKAPRDLTPADLDDTVPRFEVIMEGPTGMVWIQRALYEDELDLFEQNGWPIVLRRDFFDPRHLTENDVLELQESAIAPGA
ncbi:MAG: prepilin-type N-terminal cleavage/methylation domain-containing protein [Phycisphaerae bacterium]|nr:MAG: prepilin-type N-terminal cleavage/methylation domain-containing protein [Phycisphaerae bacterium]NUQ10421.1 prepilin-type N-terminal cleavage/methylation domain-containing protein [Phycisphaerae bacterium]